MRVTTAFNKLCVCPECVCPEQAVYEVELAPSEVEAIERAGT